MNRRLVTNTAMCLAVCALSATAGEPTLSTVVVEGQLVEGVGVVTSIDNLAVNNNGEWIVEADTNASSDSDSVLLRNGVLYLREGDPLTLPAGAAIGSFDTMNINVFGNSFWNFFLDNLPSDENSGIFFGDDLVIQESAFSTAPEFSPNTPYLGFFELKYSDTNDNRAIVLATVDDPNIASSVDQAFVALTYNPNTQQVTESVLIKEGDIPAGMSDPIADFETNPHTMSLASNAEHSMFVLDTTGGTGTDTAVMLDGNIVAREGDPSPVGGIPWMNFGTNTRVSVNDLGHYALLGRIQTGNSANDNVIIRNGQVFIREGDAPPGIGGNFQITSFGTGPVLMVDGSDLVIWESTWNDSNPDIDSALFLNDQVLIREGMTSIDGRVVDTISMVQDGFAASPNGQFVIVEVTFNSGQNAAVLIEIPTSSEAATLTAVDVQTGTILDGGLAELTTSDDQYFHTRSGFGQTLIDLHNLTMDVSATTTITNPSMLAMDIESFIDHSSGTARVLMFDWNKNAFEQVDTYQIDPTERTRHVEVADAAQYVNSNGEMIVRIRHLVFVPQFAFLFESWFDSLQIEVAP